MRDTKTKPTDIILMFIIHYILSRVHPQIFVNFTSILICKSYLHHDALFFPISSPNNK